MQPRTGQPSSDRADGGGPRLSFDLQRFFTGASVLVFVLAFLVFSVSVVTLVDATLVSIAKDQTDSIVEDIAILCRAHGFPPHAWHGEMPAALRAEILAEMENFGLTELVLHALDGRELQRLSLGGLDPSFSWPDGVRQAASGRIALRSSVAVPWHLAMLGLGPVGEADVAVPIRDEGRVTSIAVVHRASAPVLGMAHRVIPWLVLLAALTSLAAFASLWLLVRRAARIIRSQTDAIDQAQRELANQNAQLVELHRRKDEFLAVCSHDLRSPVLAVHAGCQLLLHDTPAGATHAREILVENLRRSEGVIRLVDNLLDLARIEAGVETPQLEVVDLRELVRESVCESRREAAPRDVRIELAEKADADLRPIHGDRMMLQRVLGNLLSNAIKHSPPGAAVTVTIAGGTGGVTRVSVADRGPGIRPEKIPLLFQPFSALARESRTRDAGTGLGLSIARRLVALHGGTIQVESEPGRGATFEIVLPAYPLSSTTR